MGPERNAPPIIPKEEFTFPNRGESVHTSHPHTFRLVLIGLVVVLFLIFLGLVGWFYLMQQTPEPIAPTITRPTAAENNEPESPTAEAAAAAQQTTSPSTALSSIETDLNGTELPDLEPLFADVEALF